MSPEQSLLLTLSSESIIAPLFRICNIILEKSRFFSARIFSAPERENGRFSQRIGTILEELEKITIFRQIFVENLLKFVKFVGLHKKRVLRTQYVAVSENQTAIYGLRFVQSYKKRPFPRFAPRICLLQFLSALSIIWLNFIKKVALHFSSGNTRPFHVECADSGAFAPLREFLQNVTIL